MERGSYAHGEVGQAWGGRSLEYCIYISRQRCTTDNCRLDTNYPTLSSFAPGRVALSGKSEDTQTARADRACVPLLPDKEIFVPCILPCISIF